MLQPVQSLPERSRVASDPRAWHRSAASDPTDWGHLDSVNKHIILIDHKVKHESIEVSDRSSKDPKNLWFLCHRESLVRIR